MLAVLGFWEYFWIAVIVSLFAGGSAVYSSFKASDSQRLRRIEGKIDLILKELNLIYEDIGPASALSEEVKAMADNPAQKIAAIKLHREQTGASLKDAKDAVEAYIAGRG